MSAPSTRLSDSIYLLGVKDLDHLSSKNQLPTTKEVLLRFHYFLQERKSVRNASHSTIEELNTIWQKSSIPTKMTKHSIEKLEKVHSEWLLLKKNKDRKTETQKSKEVAFIKEINKLFDIAHADAENMIKIDEDKAFLIDQRTNRKMIITSEDKEYNLKQKRIQERKEILEKRKEKLTSIASSSCLGTKSDLDFIENLSSTSSSNDQSDDETYHPSSKKKMVCKNLDEEEKTAFEPKSRKTLFTENVTSALDRNKISDREAMRLIVPIVAALGHDPASMPVSRSTIKRKRKEARHNIAEEVKKNLEIKEPVIVHWDGKILPDILGSEKVDRLPVLISFGKGEEKLLGVPKVASATGVNTGNAVHGVLQSWDLDRKIIGMGFDTTAVNTGAKNGACTLLEYKIEQELLWLACRHHILEVILSTVFTVCLGPSSSPDIPLFKRLKETWASIERTQYSLLTLSAEEEELKNSTIEVLVPLLKRKDHPRDDYLELIEMTLLVLGHPLENVHWRGPGPIHHARWMAKLIYSIKIYLFHDQGIFHLTTREKHSLNRFVKFGVLLYVKYWVEAPIAANAPVNDLTFWKDAGKYSILDNEISVTVRTTLQRHLWYLSDELVGLALFSEKVTEEEKTQIVENLTKVPLERMVRGNPALLKDDSELCDFASSRTALFISKLNIDPAFLQKHPSDWEKDPKFAAGKTTVKHLKVVNDIAERGVKLFQDFNKLMTNDEEEKQLLLQVVEANRKRVPTEPTKKALLGTIEPSTSKK